MSGVFDVFLSHNSQDTPAVRELAVALRERGLRVWLDEDELRPGVPWQRLLEDGIRTSASVTVLIGKDGLGPWENEEMQAALRLAVKDGRPVIPVILPDAPQPPDLPLFLTNRTWVDLRPALFEAGLDRLVWGITGVKPKQPSGGAEDGLHPKRITVFVADVPDSLQAQRDWLISEISPRALVLPAVPPPWEYAPHRQRVTELCQSADLAIHLVDRWPGRRVNDQAGTTYPREQAQIALGLSVPTLVWALDTLQTEAIEDAAHRTWLQQLESGARGGTSYEFVRATPRALLDLVTQKLQELEQPYAYKLAGLLAERGADVDFNKESQDPTQSLTNFEQAVRKAGNLVIVFGQVTSAWLQGRIKTAVKVLAEQLASEPAYTLENIWVFLLPGSQGSAIPRLPPVIRISVLDNSGSETIDPGVVAQMLAPPGTEGRL